jgi:quinone-modifying oxidoreductase, subunit QmoC
MGCRQNELLEEVFPMSDRLVVDADLKFVEDVIKAGGADLKKCYQCSTCTVACPLTPEGAPFPRKEMIAAQWGIKDRLIKSMDAWLCFHCNDCSDQCPRGAKPGDVMAAIRHRVIAEVSVPSVIAKGTTTVGGSLILLLIPMLILAAVISGLHWGTGFTFLQGEIIFSKMIPVTAIDLIFVPAALFAVITAFISVKKLLAGLKESYPPGPDGEPLPQALIGTVKDILSHAKFRECGVNQPRNIAHMLLFYSFGGLLITTACVVVIHYGFFFFGWFGYDTPLPFFHPVKILGNISAVGAITGIALIVGRRMTSSKIGSTVTFEWIFLLDVLLIIVTGILAQATRVYDLNPLAYIIYYLHLTFVFFLFAYAPHSKFGHMFYRTAALVYARYSGRNQSVSRNLLEMTKQAVPETTEAA